MKKILVTGSSGLVGTHLIEKLLEKGYNVIGVDFKSPAKIIDNQNFKFISFDLRNQTDVSLLFNDFKFDGVINAFGIKGSPIKAKENPLDFLEPSIKVNTNIIDNCFKHNSWFEVGLGIGAIKTHLIEDFVKSNDLEKFNSLNIEINESIKQRVKVSTPHNIFLKSLGAKI